MTKKLSPEVKAANAAARAALAATVTTLKHKGKVIAGKPQPEAAAQQPSNVVAFVKGTNKPAPSQNTKKGREAAKAAIEAAAKPVADVPQPEPVLPPQVEAAVKDGDVSGKRKRSNGERQHSVAPKPTKKVWVIADSMPDAKRSDVIAACALQGITYNTASTQYYLWKQSKANDAARATK